MTKHCRSLFSETLNVLYLHVNQGSKRVGRGTLR